MVQRKRSTRVNSSSQEASTEVNDYKSDCAGYLDDPKPELPVSYRMTQEQCIPTNHDWNSNPLDETNPPPVYGQHLPMEQYGATAWGDGWQHSIGSMMSREDGAVHMDGPLVDATNMALAQATAIPEGRVVGVYFDKQRRIWRATWREHGQGKRKTKNFSVDDYGFEEARRMAIQFRLVKLMEASDQALQEQGILQQQGVSAHDYESNMTPTGGSNRKKRRRYGSPETFAPKLPLWAQPYCNEGADEVHQASQIWPPLYGHPAAFVHMEQLRSTQQSWADTSEDRMQMCVAEHAQAPTLERGMLDRADMVSTVDSMGQEHHKLYEAEPRPAGSGIIC